MKKVFAALPMSIALAHLFDVALSERRLLPGMSGPAFLVIVWWPVGTWFYVRSRHGAQRGLQAAALASCVVAPLAVFASWALMPGAIFASTASFGTFLHWLTKYPSLGPINREVLGGIVCVLTASLLPWFFAMYRMTASAPRPRALWAMVALQLAVYAPLVWRLDAAQLVYGAIMLPGLPAFGAAFLGGALARLAATAAMTFLCLSAAGTARPQR